MTLQALTAERQAVTERYEASTTILSTTCGIEKEVLMRVFGTVVLDRLPWKATKDSHQN